MTQVTRFYISGTRTAFSETFWNGKVFTRIIDECKVYTRKADAQKQLVKLINEGYSDIQLQEVAYTI